MDTPVYQSDSIDGKLPSFADCADLIITETVLEFNDL